MADIKLFYLEGCPHCQRAFKFIEEIKAEMPVFKDLQIELIEESERSKLANSYNYFYVPCFYVNENKVHEGITTKADILKVFEKAKE